MKALFLCVTFFVAAFADDTNSHFYRTFNKLHQEPPPPEPSISGRILDVKTNWINQKLDHFDESNDKTWKMRYLSSAKHFKSGGPIFIFVGGEWAVSSGYLVGGHIQPTENLSTENLKYLDVRQALHDLNNFIETVKKEIPGLAESKVIITGGSYSATMVTWFQVMFPNVAAGSWASSAPLLAKLDFIEYKEIVGSSIKQMGGEQCYNRIQNGIDTLEMMIDNNRVAEVKALFKLCNSFDAKNDLDVYTFFSEISEIFAGIVQTHSGNSIQNACKKIMDSDDDVQDAFKTDFTNFVLQQNTEKTNQLFGGLDPGTDNVYFTHGQLDPWRAMGLQEEGKPLYYLNMLIVKIFNL
uniref:Uncharacterized protein n=1 Tax=Megaselia scalaris TaxID=36166 RepID=T1GS61_MEGSC